MLFVKKAVVLYAAVTITRTAAHGIVTGIVAGGLYYEGYDTTFQFETSPPQGTTIVFLKPGDLLKLTYN